MMTSCMAPQQDIERDIADITWNEGRIVFFSNRSVPDTRPFTSQTNTRYLFVMTEDGSEQAYYKEYGQRLISTHVAWSPDGSRLAVPGIIDEPPSCLMIIDSEGHQCLVEKAQSPSWSPNGEWIAFNGPVTGQLSTIEFNGALKLINVNTLEQKQLAEFKNISEFLVSTWSPDSNTLAFSVKIDNGIPKIYYIDMNNDENTLNFLTFGNSPAWSPDGAHLAFERANDIWLTTIDGEEHLFVTNGSSPSWSPDGESMVFASSRSGNWEIYKINKDGTGLTNLTNTPENDYVPSWRP
jgi:Tol biopolymer transport system component